MAKPNYAFAKRQRELAKRQKAEEKRARKVAGSGSSDADTGSDAVAVEHDGAVDAGAVTPGEHDVRVGGSVQGQEPGSQQGGPPS